MNIVTQTLRVTVGGLLLCASVGPSDALAVTETTDWSDFHTTSSTLGALAVGSNTITGSISCDRQYDRENDYGGFDTWCYGDTDDFFNFEVLDGMQLTSASVAVANFMSVDGPGSTYSLDYAPDGLLELGYGLATFSADGATGNLLDGVLGAGSYLTSMGTWTTGSDALGETSYDYTMTLTVEALPGVPLPASGVLLFGAAFGAFAFRLRAAL